MESPSPSASGSKGKVRAANRVNSFLEKAMPLITPLGVALGVLLPGVFINLRPLVPWLFGTMTLAGALKLRVRELGRAVSSPLPLLFFFFTAHVLLPLVVLALSSLVFRNDPDTVSGYVLLYSTPVAVTSFIWVTIFKGDLALALALILLDTILAPFVVPGTVRLLLGANVNLDMKGMAVSLILMVAIPTILGVAINELSKGKIPGLINPWLTPFSKICMPLVIAANSAAVAPQVRLDNPRVWLIVAACVSFSALGFVCGKCTGLAGKLGREKQVSLFFASGLRNTSAAMILGTQFFPPAAALPSVLGIMFQQTIAAVMGRVLLKRKE